jgi:hypothetical protein
MADVLIESGDFGTDSALILASRDFTSETTIRWAFTVTDNPGGFAAQVLPSDGSVGVQGVISGTGVHVVAFGPLPAGSYVFQVQSLGGVAAASSYSIFAGDPNDPGPPPGPGGETEPPFTVIEPPLMVVKADQEETPEYRSDQ